MKSTALTTHLYAPSTDLWDWQMNATCRSMGTDLIFSPAGEGVTSTSLRRSACVENRPPKPMPTAGGGACVSGDDSSVHGWNLLPQRLGSSTFARVMSFGSASCCFGTCLPSRISMSVRNASAPMM